MIKADELRVSVMVSSVRRVTCLNVLLLSEVLQT